MWICSFICFTVVVVTAMICAEVDKWQRQALEHDQWTREKKIQHQQWLVAAEMSRKPKPTCEEE